MYVGTLVIPGKGDSIGVIKTHGIKGSKSQLFRLRMSGVLQVPMVWVTEWLKQKLNKPFVGNVIFWVTFCVIGQPLCIMMYYHDYKHGVVGPSV